LQWIDDALSPNRLIIALLFAPYLSLHFPPFSASTARSVRPQLPHRSIAVLSNFGGTIVNVDVICKLNYVLHRTLRPMHGPSAGLLSQHVLEQEIRDSYETDQTPVIIRLCFCFSPFIISTRLNHCATPNLTQSTSASSD
jgi:hypothetical protein